MSFWGFSISLILSGLKLAKVGFREGSAGLIYPHMDFVVHLDPFPAHEWCIFAGQSARSRTTLHQTGFNSGSRIDRVRKISIAISWCV